MIRELRTARDIEDALTAANWTTIVEGEGDAMRATAIVCPLCAALVNVSKVNGSTYNPRAMHIRYHANLARQMEYMMRRGPEAS